MWENRCASVFFSGYKSVRRNWPAKNCWFWTVLEPQFRSAFPVACRSAPTSPGVDRCQWARLFRGWCCEVSWWYEFLRDADDMNLELRTLCTNVPYYIPIDYRRLLCKLGSDRDTVRDEQFGGSSYLLCKQLPHSRNQWQTFFKDRKKNWLIIIYKNVY